MGIEITLSSFWMLFGVMVFIGFILYRDLS